MSKMNINLKHKKIIKHESEISAHFACYVMKGSDFRASCLNILFEVTTVSKVLNSCDIL